MISLSLAYFLCDFLHYMGKDQHRWNAKNYINFGSAHGVVSCMSISSVIYATEEHMLNTIDLQDKEAPNLSLNQRSLHELSFIHLFNNPALQSAGLSLTLCTLALFSVFIHFPPLSHGIFITLCSYF